MLFEFFQLFFLASLKYFLTIPLALINEMDYEVSVLAILSGGMGGFLFFYYLLKPLTGWARKAGIGACRCIPGYFSPLKERICAMLTSTGKKKIFSKRNRTIVRIKRSYGLWGLIVTTPVFLSIPVGAFLASHYYAGNKRVVLYMLLSILVWGLLFAFILRLFPGIIH